MKEQLLAQFVHICTRILVAVLYFMDLAGFKDSEKKQFMSHQRMLSSKQCRLNILKTWEKVEELEWVKNRQDQVGVSSRIQEDLTCEIAALGYSGLEKDL